MSTKAEREAPEIGAMVRRMIRALVRRAAAGDLEALEVMVGLSADLPGAIRVAGLMMNTGERMALGQSYSFTELAAPLGITRQAARQFCQQPVNPAAIRYWTAQ